ncbi:hypothetical protein PanWU01x14_185240, partial [Parasponia andersonii]
VHIRLEAELKTLTKSNAFCYKRIVKIDGPMSDRHHHPPFGISNHSTDSDKTTSYCYSNIYVKF